MTPINSTLAVPTSPSIGSIAGYVCRGQGGVCLAAIARQYPEHAAGPAESGNAGQEFTGNGFFMAATPPLAAGVPVDAAGLSQV